MDPSSNIPFQPADTSAAPMQKPVMPVEWSWIAQRQQTDGDATSIWKIGFVAPDGGEVRVTFHQVGQTPSQPPPDPAQQPLDPQQQGIPEPGQADQEQPQDDGSQDPNQSSDQDPEKADKKSSTQDDAALAKSVDPSVLSAVNKSLGDGGGAAPGGAPGAPGMAPQGDPSQMGGDPSAMGMPGPPPVVPIKGQPNVDQTTDSTFYITFFANRHPESFMLWDTSLSHEDSLVVWVTITHGIVDFVRKAKPANVILDDLANAKLKMVLRSVAMDVAAANPEYEIEQTQKHHYRSYYQIKQKGSPSAFADQISGRNVEGDTQPLPIPGAGGDNIPGDKTEDPTMPQPAEPIQKNDDAGHQPFPSAGAVPIKQTPPESTVPAKKGLTLEIGRDYSVAVKDKDGNAIDRYRGKSPVDVLRWINTRGYGANRMKIVTQEQPSGAIAESMFTINGNVVEMNTIVTPKRAAIMNYTINAQKVRMTEKSLCFEFVTDRDMNFKRALVELAYQNTASLN